MENFVWTKEDIIQLESVGCGIHKDIHLVYTQNKDGSYECGNDDGTHINDCTNEWVEGLSVKDIQIIFQALLFNY